MMAADAAHIVVNGTLQPAGQPFASASSRGLMYGDGCFETFCSHKGRFFKLEDHLRRLQHGVDYLDISYPPDLKIDRIGLLLERLVSKNSLQYHCAIIRLQVWRQGQRGYATTSRQSGYMITAVANTSIRKSYRLRTVPIRRIPSAALPSQFKFTNGINYIKAAKQAQEQGGDDALMQTVQGWVSETTIANVFWMHDGNIYTPSVKCDILPGITRNAVIKLLKNKLNLQVNEGEFNLENIKKADFAWICNSVKEIVPVSELDEIEFDHRAPVIQDIQAVYKSHYQQKLKRLGDAKGD